MSREKNHVQGHIRYMFVFRLPLKENAKSPKYYSVLLTDRNEVYFDKFAFLVPKKSLSKDKFIEQVQSKINILEEKVRKLFWQYEIDENTEIVFAGFEKIEDNDLYYKTFKFVESFEKVYVSKTQLSFVCDRVARYFHEDVIKEKLSGLEAVPKRTSIAIKISRLYKLLLETGKCPWINSKTDIKVNMFSSREAMHYGICLVGLWFMAVRQYYRTCNENYGHVVMKGRTFKTYDPGSTD